MNLALVSALLFSLLAAVAKAAANIRGPVPADVLCLVMKVHKTGKGGHHDFFTCDLILEQEGVVHFGLLIELPETVVNQHEEVLRRGEWYVKISGATVEETYIEGHGMLRTSVSVPPGATIVTIPTDDGKTALRKAEGQVGDVSRARNLLSTGTHTLMVIRVSVTDSQPTFNTSQLTSDYFNMNSYSLVRQYHWCSFGQIQFVAYDASNPVVDVLIAGKASSFTSSTLRQLAVNAAAALKKVTYLTSIAMHVAIVLPPRLADDSTTSPWYALGQVGGWWTAYNDKWGAYPQFQMHELGHNLGMGHAGVGSDQYADQSDIMGYGDSQQYGITKCFNGYHYWYLQWFASRSLTVNPYDKNLVTIAAFPDYNLTSASQSVIIKVDSYYLIYNRRKGINYSNRDAIDKVTVAQATSNVFSLRVAALDSSTGAFQIPNYAGGSQPLTILVCSNTKGNLVDYAVVSIGIGAANCTSGLNNTQITASPTRRPTPSPTKKPTSYPTWKPTYFPTPLPTRSPTRKPTEKPTRSPTQKPTAKPTSRPTEKPTKQPTRGPTLKPTKSPTARPTQKPTSSPTSKPTKAPTPYPTQKPTLPLPTKLPTSPPTVKPSKQPTTSPSQKPSPSPSQKPSQKPSPSPSQKPSVATSSPTANPPPSDSPVNPTPAPVASTEAPATPTESPVSPTEAPATPTEAPVSPTEAPATPTEAPVLPTEAPATPTEAPVSPTEAPATPTGAPVVSTDAPVAPTPSPVVPTEAPVSPTVAPNKLVTADPAGSA